MYVRLDTTIKADKGNQTAVPKLMIATIIIIPTRGQLAEKLIKNTHFSKGFYQ